jgi:deoxyribodipyrimidine photo-lyase
MSTQPPPTLLWIRKDFRLADNAALQAAIEAGAPVIPVFIRDPAEGGGWAPGAASRWWLHHALEHFATAWQERGGALVLRQGDSLSVLQDLIRETGAERVYWNRRYEPVADAADERIRQTLRQARIGVGAFNSSLLVEPHSVKTGSGNPYQVYTPFWRSVSQNAPSAPARLDLGALRFPPQFPPSDPLDALGLLPQKAWHLKLGSHWTPSEAAARQRLKAFAQDPINAYHEGRDRPDHDGTSCLSPHLHWGHLGPRQVMAAVHHYSDPQADGPATFIKEIYWREFAYHVLHHFPHTPDQPLRPQFADFPWVSDSDHLRRWQRGQTGYPIVDAGMRQLWATGWMHNRVRMITASVLVKHLLTPWTAGARWFWDTLVDADLASNTLGWQWSGGCGADAAPYFRIFNPVLQARKFDPEGAYIRRWVPELARLPNCYLHAPWEASPNVRQASGVHLDDNYPAPLIDLKEGRERALAALATLKG